MYRLTLCPVSMTLTPLRVTSVAPCRALSRKYAVRFVGCGNTLDGVCSVYVLIMLLSLSRRLLAVAFAM